MKAIFLPALVVSLVAGSGPAAAQPLDTLPVPHAYRRALDAGTRAANGEPGPRYWQQHVSFKSPEPACPRAPTVHPLRELHPESPGTHNG